MAVLCMGCFTKTLETKASVSSEKYAFEHGVFKAGEKVPDTAVTT